MFVTLVMTQACPPEGRLCRPDYLSAPPGRAGRRPGGGPAPFPLNFQVGMRVFLHAKLHCARAHFVRLKALPGGVAQLVERRLCKP